MPRRNLFVLFAAALVSLACYQTADRNPLGRYFSDVADLIEHRYVNNVDRATLWSGAVKGMLSELGDPYSEYFPPREAADFEELLTGEFGGIGVQVSVDQKTGLLTIISPIVGSPAYKAGILAGDVITAIDGKSTKGMKYEEATTRIRGTPGESVAITVERPGEKEPHTFSVKREVIDVDSVLGDGRGPDDRWDFLIERNPNIGYIRIASFGERTVAEMQTAMEQLKSRGVQGLVIDLRNDPGGLLPAAKDVADMFLPEGKPIVSIKGRGQNDRKYTASGKGEKFLDIPLVVLINDHSASAAEILAAALQDNGRAVIIGKRSYGKGTVQNVIELPGREGMLKLTTAGYIRPNGKNIHRQHDAKETDEWGVSPNDGFGVKLSTEEEKKWMEWRRDRDIVRPHEDHPAEADDAGGKIEDALKSDPPLLRAIEYIKSQLKNTANRPAAA